MKISLKIIISKEYKLKVSIINDENEEIIIKLKEEDEIIPSISFENNIISFFEENEKSTIITVSDNGGGVDKEDVGKLFKRFHRTKNAKPQSAGIGLAITKEIVEKHHGTISAVNSEKGLNIIMCFPHIDGYQAI